MKYVSLMLPLIALLAPSVAGAAEPVRDANSPNVYFADPAVRITNALPADLITAGGSVSVEAPVGGDVLAAGGTLDVRSGAGGDVRVLGGRARVVGPVNGDVAAAAGTLGIFGTARTIYAAGASVTVEASSTGAARIYGANVALGGTYGGNVSVVASNRLNILPGTRIRGTLTYSAPEQLALPESVIIEGGVRYTGSYAYLPTKEQVRQYALAGAGIFFLVRVLAGAIVAGLLAGLFPKAAEKVSALALARKPRTLLKTFLIGISVAILTPLLILFLFISLVGAGLSLLLSILYALLFVVAYATTGIVLGYLLRQVVLYRIYGEREPLWQDAVVGTALVHSISLIPLLGTATVFLFAMLCAGALATCAFTACFPALPPRLTRAHLKTYDHESTTN